MTAPEKTLFNQVLQNFQENYPDIIVSYPYEDEYIEFSINGTKIGGFNQAGSNLLYCLTELTMIYEFKLL